MAPASGADPVHGTERLVRVFCDADVLIAGAASTTGASHILLQLSELTLIECVSSPLVVEEAERNIAAKLPAALPAFREILDAGIDLVPEASSAASRGLAAQAHQKNVPILAAAVAADADLRSAWRCGGFSFRIKVRSDRTWPHPCRCRSDRAGVR